MRIARATRADLAQWAEMRAALWPEASEEEHREEIARIVASLDPGEQAFIAHDAQGRALGFAEASIRHDYVPGCETSPVVYLEGIYVRPDARIGGVGRALDAAVAAWGKACGCREYASDALLDNTDSHRFHAAIGFAETERVVYFRKEL